jgi:trehalose-6-phosphate synthase
LTRSLVSESALIAAKYTEESVDEMMKPDADTDAYKERMVELRKKVKRDIYAWTKSFVNEAQRQPSKQERKDLASAMFRAYTGVRA